MRDHSHLIFRPCVLLTHYIKRSTMSEKGTVTIVLNGAWRLNVLQRKSLIRWIKDGIEEIVTKAGKSLIVELPINPKKGKQQQKPQFRIDLDFTDASKPKRRCGLFLGECGTGTIYIGNHKYMGVCGDDPKTRNKRFLVTDELLGHALANTTLHEVGHVIGNFPDNLQAGNFMSTQGAPKAQRTVETQRAYFAGKMSWTNTQAETLVANIKINKKAFEDEFTVTPVSPEK